MEDKSSAQQASFYYKKYYVGKFLRVLKNQFTGMNESNRSYRNHKKTLFNILNTNLKFVLSPHMLEN